MVSVIVSLLLALAQGPTDPMFDMRARDILTLGKGAQSGTTYYDVVITRQPAAGVLIKLPYTRKGGKLTFDLHHRISMTPEFSAAEVTTVVEILTGGTTSVGTFALSDKINPGDKFQENILKTAAAGLDSYVTPLATKSVSLETRPGPQSLSIVGKTQTVTRGSNTTRVDTPNARIAVVSNLKFEEVTEKNPLKKSPDLK